MFFSKPAKTEIRQLDLSGEALANNLEQLIRITEEQGGIETWVEALKAKHILFTEIFSKENVLNLEPKTMADIAGFMPTVRRKIGQYLEDKTAFANLKEAIIELVNFGHDSQKVDENIAKFCAHFPNDKKHRFVRDLASEILHGYDPMRYPIMNRWLWDMNSNTGVVREIWFGDIDSAAINLEDDYLTFITLRKEIAEYLMLQGMHTDTHLYVDILCAQIYAQYIASQGGSYLRADFTAPEDSASYLRRLLGLDGIKAKTQFKNQDNSKLQIENLAQGRL